MRTKFSKVEGIDDNENFYNLSDYNEELPDNEKLSQKDLEGRWLAALPDCTNHKCIENGYCELSCDYNEDTVEACANCVYYGEFELIESDPTVMDAQHMCSYIPNLRCVRRCLNCENQCCSHQN